MGANLGYIFYKDLYDISDRGPVARQSIIEQVLLRRGIDENDELSFKAPDEQCILFETVYPGLLTGLGLPHGVKDDDEDFKTGLYFDHTYGLPVIPGSSVKGILRSLFPTFEGKRKTPESKKTEKAAWVLAQFQHIKEEDFLNTTYQPLEQITAEQRKWVQKLELEIFEGIAHDTGKPLPLSKRDIFHDAIIKEPAPENKILDRDYITPHPDPLKDPKPIQILKVLPGVVFRFQFDLKSGLILADEKLKLFEKILLTTGAGAKTNVGYGQFQ